MHELLSPVITRICQSVSTSRSCPNTAEWIKILLGVETFEDSSNIVLEGAPISHGFSAAFAILLHYCINDCKADQISFWMDPFVEL